MRMNIHIAEESDIPALAEIYSTFEVIEVHQL
jgi:hypothetical protein